MINCSWILFWDDVSHHFDGVGLYNTTSLCCFFEHMIPCVLLMEKEIYGVIWVVVWGWAQICVLMWENNKTILNLVNFPHCIQCYNNYWYSYLHLYSRSLGHYKNKSFSLTSIAGPFNKCNDIVAKEIYSS